ncbi:adenylosuccinate synthetase [Planosporangium thailandense]|uniref:Adenylosuccinate synthetase n=1 Tax=Planosporangium thailandense TaxID=765197 RepID=A0ABX0Y2B5_9ACTN|nr:adenylosuccinate synthetase [Planosporangium thailandense]NJC72277.1 adenylosuccinate synthetase [Planosporangium thailandense]
MPIFSPEALDDVVDARHHERMRESLRPLLTPELISEHARQPFGQHSDALQRVLNYLGRFPVPGKLICEYGGDENWFVCRLVDDAGLRAARVAGPFPTEAAAIDAVFRQRLHEIFGVATG